MLKEGDIFNLIGRAYKILAIKKIHNTRFILGNMVKILAGEKILDENLYYHYNEYWVEMEPLTEDPLKIHRKRTIVWKESDFLNKHKA